MTNSNSHVFDKLVQPRVTSYRNFVGSSPRFAAEDLAALMEKEPGLTVFQRALKRLLDIVIGLTAFALFLPIFVVVGFTLMVSSTEPVFRRDKVVGYKGRMVNILTFNVVNRSDFVAEVVKQYRLDVLPRWLNIIFGSFSLVGPAPHTPAKAIRLEAELPDYVLRQSVRPGLMSWSAVQNFGRNSFASAEQELESDKSYLKDNVLLLDFLVLILTLKFVFLGGGGEPSQQASF